MSGRAYVIAGALLTIASVAVGTVERGPLAIDHGASGVWQALLKLQTTGSVLQVVAHPDEEPGGVMTWLSRHEGARLSSLTLTRGEAGDNALGPEAFDALGLLRTEELLVSNRYYGVDSQYFTAVVDVGFTKRSGEAFTRWGRENVLRDVVRVIRLNRPLVLMSRFDGTSRDGHGSSSAASLVMREAFNAAGDPASFPEQVREGLLPWRPLKMYVGARPDEEWTIRVDPGMYGPWLGQSFADLARQGLSFQRSSVSDANSGRHHLFAGPAPVYYKCVESAVPVGAKEERFFEGIDTSIRGVFNAVRKPEPSSAGALLAAIDAAVENATASFTVRDPSATVPALAEGLAATRTALTRLGGADADALFLLKIKEQQFQDAINTALGIDLSAMAQRAGLPDPTGPFAEFAPPPAMGAPVPGQTFEIRARVTNRGGVAIMPTEVVLTTDPGWTVTQASAALAPLGSNASATARFVVTLAADAPLRSRPYFGRASIQGPRYTVTDPTQFGRPRATPSAVVVFRYTVTGVVVEKAQIVQRREPRLPDGDAVRELRAVPALSISVSPRRAVVPVAAPVKRLLLTIDLVNNYEGAIDGQLTLTLPTGWRADPAHQPFAFTRAGEQSTYPITVHIPALENRAYRVAAVATTNGRRYTEGYELIDQRDLDLAYVYRPSTVQVHGLDVQTVSGLHIGYITGVGDQVPAGIAQLGYAVTILDHAALATGDLVQFDAIMIGTRAYAVRDDLRTYNGRLLDYVRRGGNLIVLYNTHELIPARFAPFPAEHGPRAEEVSEEDAPVRILAPTAQVFTWPNRITMADFDGWVEQRGSKFWAAWDGAYTPMIETFDQGQAPQRGGWLQAKYGKGTYTYFAYAFHRQLPYGVPGAYRLLANLLALGKMPSRP